MMRISSSRRKSSGFVNLSIYPIAVYSLFIFIKMYAEHLIMFLRKDKGIFLSLQVFFVFFCYYAQLFRLLFVTLQLLTII